jgi:hypothetical protein
MNVATETIELRDSDRTLPATSFCEGSRQLRPPVERVRALPGLNFCKGCRDLETFRFGEAS